MAINFFSKKEKKESTETVKEMSIDIKDIVAPSYIGVSQNNVKLGDKINKSYFIFSYPRYLNTGWISPIINLNVPMDISFFIYPIDNKLILKKLVSKVTMVSSELLEREEKGLISDPALETGYRDIENLRNRVITAQEKVFKFGLYITIYEDTEERIKEIEVTLRSIFESRLIYIKPASFRQKEGFISTSPYGLDQLSVQIPINTDPLSTCFPFISFDLSSDEGILYGINGHNSSLVLFDRFTLENSNSVVFAKSGSGKSYAIKLEILRYLMWGIDVIVA